MYLSDMDIHKLDCDDENNLYTVEIFSPMRYYQ